MTRSSKQEQSSLEGWMEVIEQSGQQYREKRERERQERCEFLRNYFKEATTRIQALDDETVILWIDGGANREVVLNEKYAKEVLANEKVLEALWEEISRRTSFDRYLLDLLE